jgi:hypothetical protein
MRKFLTWGAVVTFGCWFLACFGFGAFGDALLQLCGGWLLFLYRVVPQMTWSSDAILAGLVCLAALGVTAHLVFRRWAPSAGWPVRKTLAVLSVFVVMFVAGLAAVGVSYQTVWLFTSGERWTKSNSDIYPRVWSSGSMKSMGFAMHYYESAAGTFPPGVLVDPQGRPLHGWQVQLLPDLDDGALASRIDLKKPWDHPFNVPAFRSPVRAFQQYGEPKHNADGLALTHYAPNIDVLGGDIPRPISAFNGRHHSTVVLGEVGVNYQPWGSPANFRSLRLGINQSPDRFGRPNRRGAQLLMMDNSVRFLSNGTSEEVLRALSADPGARTP